MEAELAKLKQELVKVKKELSQVASSETEGGALRVKRDLSLQALIKPWGGGPDEVSVEEFIQNLEDVASSGGWSEADLKIVCRNKLMGAAALCISGHQELRVPNANFEDFKNVLRQRFVDLATPAQRLLELNSLRQRSDESARDFADRCLKYGAQTIPSGSSSGGAGWGEAQVESCVIAAYIKGLRGEAGRQLRYDPPGTLREAMWKAARVEEVEGNRRGGYEWESMQSSGASQVGMVSTSRQNTSEALACFRCHEKGHVVRNCPIRSPRDNKVMPNSSSSSEGRTKQKKLLYCFVCGECGHFARNCSKRAKGPKVQGCQLANMDPNDVGSPVSPTARNPSF